MHTSARTVRVKTKNQDPANPPSASLHKLPSIAISSLKTCIPATVSKASANADNSE